MASSGMGQLSQSMSRRGNCWDNAVAESFFAGLKKHTVYGYTLTSRQAMRQRVFEYIEIYYNRVRRHSANGWQTPVEFERLYH